MRRLLPAAAAAVVSVIVLCGCTTMTHPGPAVNTPVITPAGSGTTPPPAATSPAPVTESADRAAVRAAGALFAARTVTEAGFNATWLDHDGLLTFGLAQQLRTAGAAGSNATWQLWHQHGATLAVVARLIADDLPPDGALRAVRHLQLTLIPHGEHWTGPPVELGVVLTLQASGGRWLVGGIHVDV